ncbi:MAG: phosphatidate cytidylyltransferase [Novosphingobium sp.]
MRVASAIAMVAVAGAALWLGGMVWTVFVLSVGIGVWLEWRGLVLRFTRADGHRTAWLAGGAVYCGIAAAVLLALREAPLGRALVLTVLVAVIATDIGAYFAGRTFGGPKIAPAISPSKTWAGLIGAMVATPLAIYAALRLAAGHPGQLAGSISLGVLIVAGAAVAITAQAGDFFESWMKRRAGVKDSGSLLPGHGGLFDRVDGLLAVLLLLAVVLALSPASFGMR